MAGNDNDDRAELDSDRLDDEDSSSSGSGLRQPPAAEGLRQPPAADGLRPEDDDGLAPEAGSRRPSLLSLLLLIAGAIWIVVALVKLNGEDAAQAPSVAIGNESETAELPDVVDDDASQAPDPALEPSTESGPNPAGTADQGSIGQGSDDSPQPADQASGTERGPPQGSLLAGKRWPQDYTAPEIVHYTIKRGGAMKTVANLYKIYHHEIQALNPGVDLDKELPPSTRIVVYKRKAGSKSESVGYPGDGKCEGTMPMVDGPGRELKHTPWKGWATETTVATLDLVLREWARRFPSEQPILVGNMSAREGGRLEPHSSHQSGRDVDLSYPQIWDRKEELNWRTMNGDNLHRELTWSLLELLRETEAIEAIFIDSKLQKLLYDYAVSTNRYTKDELAAWMEYPKPPGTGKPLIQHVRGHEDHIHVRFKCTAAEGRCKSRDRE